MQNPISNVRSKSPVALWHQIRMDRIRRQLTGRTYSVPREPVINQRLVKLEVDWDARHIPWPRCFELVAVAVLGALMLLPGPATGQMPSVVMPPRGATNAAPVTARSQISRRPTAPRRTITTTGWATSTSGVGKVHALVGTNLVCHTPLKSWVGVPTGPATCIKCRALTGQPYEETTRISSAR